MKDRCDKKRYLAHEQLLIYIPLECLQTIKDQDSELYVHRSFALSYLDFKSNADSTPAIKFSKSKSRSNKMKSIIKKTINIRIIPPNDKTENLTPLSYDGFRYRSVNSDWRIINSKEVLDNETDLPLLIEIKIAIIQIPI